MSIFLDRCWELGLCAFKSALLAVLSIIYLIVHVAHSFAAWVADHIEAQYLYVKRWEPTKPRVFELERIERKVGHHGD